MKIRTFKQNDAEQVVNLIKRNDIEVRVLKQKNKRSKNRGQKNYGRISEKTC